MNLLIHQGALGDFVLTFPILRALAPQPTVVIAPHSKAALAADCFRHVIARSIDQRDWSLLHADGGAERIDEETRALLRAQKRIISFVSSGDDAWATNVRSLTHTPTRLVFLRPRPPAEWQGHVCDWHAHQLAEQGLALPTDPGIKAGGDPNGPVVVHPCSGGATKCWPIDRFEAIIERLHGEGIATCIDLGEVEVETWPEERIERWRNAYGATDHGSLSWLAQRLRTASLFIGNDSGPAHLAAQLGVPTIAMFGAINATHWAPGGSRVKVLAPPVPCEMKWLSVEEVWETIQSPLS